MNLNEITSIKKSSSKGIIKPNCRIRAANDIEAVECFLNEYIDKATTFRSYKKETERFLVWCIKERQVLLSTLNRDDVEAYLSFVKDPKPREIWCGPKGGKKRQNGEKIWYPFAGPLSENAIKTAITILHSMMSYLVDACYVEVNPFALIRRKNRFKDQMIAQALKIEERILDEREWQALLETMNNEEANTMEEIKKKERLKFLIAILFYLGLRIDELSKARWQNFNKINEKWWFFIKGKGDRLGKIPVNSSLLTALMNYRHSQGLRPLPNNDDISPIIPSLSNSDHSLSARQMSNLIKNLVLKTAQKFVTEPRVHMKLQKFSPHWLRHLSASRQDLAGISFTNIKSNLRHQNEQTTRQYVHAYDDERHKEMEKLRF